MVRRIWVVDERERACTTMAICIRVAMYSRSARARDCIFLLPSAARDCTNAQKDAMACLAMDLIRICRSPLGPFS